MSQIQTVFIKSITAHPKASKLKICTVNDGKSDYQIVCGASNVREQMKTILAPIDSVLPSGLAIQKADLRGVESFGMLCSAKDLGISSESGLIDLPAETKIGLDWKSIPKNLLSSIPWHNYKLVDSLIENTTTNEIQVVRGEGKIEESKNLKCLSQTYFYNGKYFYRNFN